MKKYLKDYIYNNSKNIFTIFLFIVIGLVVGIFIFNVSDENLKQEIIQSIRNTLYISKNNNFEGINIIINSLSTNITLICIIYFISLTLIPRLLINLVSMLKGISLGLYIPVLFNIFGISNGIISLLILIVIPNIIYISSYIYLCNNAILFHKKILEEGFKFSNFCLESVKVVITFSLMLASVILEQISVIIIISRFI